MTNFCLENRTFLWNSLEKIEFLCEIALKKSKFLEICLKNQFFTLLHDPLQISNQIDATELYYHNDLRQGSSNFPVYDIHGTQSVLDKDVCKSHGVVCKECPTVCKFHQLQTIFSILL